MLKILRASLLSSLVVAILVFTLAEISVNAQRRQPPTTSPSTPSQADPLKALQWRSIGPFRGGRSTTVTGVASQPMVFYFGGTGGGGWKTTDRGINWEPGSDGSGFCPGFVCAIGLSDFYTNP